MYTFLVLGYVPGTTIQINFQTWLNVAGLLAIFYCLYRYRSQHQVEILRIERQPLHATQLHQRG